MKVPAFQDLYTDDLAVCYGCGKHNDQGLQIKSFWQEVGRRTIARFRPAAHHTGGPGFVYGGLIASLIDCHGIGSAAAFYVHEQGWAVDTQPYPRYVTATLEVRYLKPTPMAKELVLYGTLLELGGRKAVIHVEVTAEEVVCAEGKVVGVRLLGPVEMPSPT